MVTIDTKTAQEIKAGVGIITSALLTYGTTKLIARLYPKEQRTLIDKLLVPVVQAIATGFIVRRGNQRIGDIYTDIKNGVYPGVIITE